MDRIVKTQFIDMSSQTYSKQWTMTMKEYTRKDRLTNMAQGKAKRVQKTKMARQI